MGVLSSVQAFFGAREQDVVVFVEDAWNEIPIAASKVRAIVKWLANVGLPTFQKELDFALPIMTTVAAGSGHAELGASLTALDAATHAVNAAIASAQTGALSTDQVVTAIGALDSAKATFNSAKALTANIVATTPLSGLPARAV
jgi:hypothetical protein